MTVFQLIRILEAISDTHRDFPVAFRILMNGPHNTTEFESGIVTGVAIGGGSIEISGVTREVAN